MDISSKGDNSSEEDDIEADMRRVFVLIDSGIDKDDAKFDPKAEEERYYDDYNEALNDIKTVGCVVVEPMYEDDDYKHIDHTDPFFDGCHNMWCPPHHGGMPCDKI